MQLAEIFPYKQVKLLLMCSTCVCPVEGALWVVGGAVVQGAVEGALVENGRHVAVWRQRRPQLWINLPAVTGV